MAVKLPSEVGCVENATVNCVAVADVTFPTAPELNWTVLSDAVVEKFVPEITSVGAFCESDAVLTVTVGGGTIVATCTAAPLVPRLDVTTTVRLPVAVGCVVNCTVNCVAVAAVTVPAAPRFNTTELLATIVAKLVPVMITVGAFCARLVVFSVTVGGGTTVATWVTVEVPPKTETVAFNTPVALGCVENVTVNCVAVAAVTVPTAPSVVNVIELFAGVVEKFVPVMTNVGAFCARFAVLAVIVGALTTVAT